MLKINKFEVVDSTNSLAKKYDIGEVIVASLQTKGRGRFEREWSSGKGGLWFSIVLKPERRIFEYNFIASIAVLKAIGRGEIKWPNDIMYNKKKICGILSEVISQGRTDKLIIGIGLNVNNEIPTELQEAATSLREIIGKETEPDKLLKKILENFERLCSASFEEILKLYKEKCGLLGKNIRVKTLNKEIFGKAADIDFNGNLILEVNGKMIKLNEGDVTISKD